MIEMIPGWHKSRRGLFANTRLCETRRPSFSKIRSSTKNADDDNERQSLQIARTVWWDIIIIIIIVDIIVTSTTENNQQ